MMSDANMNSLDQRLPRCGLWIIWGLLIVAAMAIWGQARSPAADPSAVATADAPGELLHRSIQAIVDRADRWRGVVPEIITAKQRLPPSGDARDYQSLSIYWWPNPDTDDGLPYVQRDGRRNPEIRDYDLPRINRFADAVEDSAIAYAMTGRDEFGQTAIDWIDAFLLDPQTGMNPNMNFAQGIPGGEAGNRQGIIELLAITHRVLPSIVRLRDHPAWTDDRQSKLHVWCRSMRDWLLQSPMGLQESVRLNNHGLWYDVQILSLNEVLGDRAASIDRLRDVTAARLELAVLPSGDQPFEWLRTKSWHYGLYNVDAMLTLCQIDRQIADSTGRATLLPTGRVGAAIDLMTTAAEAGRWPYQEIQPVDWRRSIAPTLWRAGAILGDSSYQELAVRWAAPGALDAQRIRWPKNDAP